MSLLLHPQGKIFHYPLHWKHRGGVEVYLHLFLTWTCGSPHVHVASPPEKDPPLPTELEAGWVPEVVQTFRRSKKCLSPARVATLDCPGHRFVNLVNAIPFPTLLLTENEREANLLVSRYQISMQSPDSMHQLVYFGKSEDNFFLPVSSIELYQQ
jgi:hypothetical protein